MKRELFAIAGGVMLIAACSASPADYRKESEKYLESDSLADEAGYRFSEAVCEQPSSEKTGTQFSCSAVDNDGDEWEFIVEITGDREITVVDGQVTG